MTTEPIGREKFAHKLDKVQDKIENLNRRAAQLELDGRGDKALKLKERAQNLADRVHDAIDNKVSAKQDRVVTEKAPKQAGVGEKLDVVA